MRAALLCLALLCCYAGFTIAASPAYSPCRPTSPVQGAEDQPEPAMFGVELERMLSNLSISNKEEENHYITEDVEEVDMLASEKEAQADRTSNASRPTMNVFGRSRSVSQKEPMYAFDYSFDERERQFAEAARKRPLPLEETRKSSAVKNNKSIFKKKKQEDRTRRFMHLFKTTVTPPDDDSPLRSKKRRL